jgi:large subunit ribosomal protein L9
VEVILLGTIRNLGKLGELVKVKPGFARNYLIPQGKAIFANKDNIAKFESRRAELEKIAAAEYQQSVARQQAIQALPPLTIAAKAGEEGKLFGSVGVRDIVDAILAAGVTVEKREVCLPEGALRALGEHEVMIELESDLTATVKVVIAPGV